MSDPVTRQIGHLAANPEMALVGNGDNRRPRTNMIVMSNKKWTDRSTGELCERTSRVRWTLWDKQAEDAMQYLRKGSHVAIEGRLENNDYEKNGEMVYSYNFVCQDIEYLDSKAEAEARAARNNTAERA